MKRGSGSGSGFINSVAKGALSNAITQGVGVATGLQKKFDWAGVAAAGVGSAVSWAGGKLGVKALGATKDANGARVEGDLSFGNIAANGLQGIARAIAGSATRSLINGSDFGDNLVSALPDAIGSTIGEVLGAYAERELHDAAESRRSSAIPTQIPQAGQNQPSMAVGYVDEGGNLHNFATMAEFAEAFPDGYAQISGNVSDTTSDAASGKKAGGPISGLNGTENFRGRDGEVDASFSTIGDGRDSGVLSAGTYLEVPGVYTIVIHGGNGGVQSQTTANGSGKTIPWSTLTEMAQRHSGNRPIMLFSCRTGYFRQGRADALAFSQALGDRPVMISTSQVWHQRSGGVQYARAFWSTNGTGASSTGGARDSGNPGYFRFINGAPSSFGFRGLDAHANRVHTIAVNISTGSVTMTAHNRQGGNLDSVQRR